MYAGSFGKASGPTEPPKAQPIFGNFGGRPPSPSPPPTTSPFSGPAPVRPPPPRGPETLGKLHSPHLAFEGASPAASHPYPPAGLHRSTESLPSWDDGQRSFSRSYDTQAQRPSAVTSFVVSRNSGTTVMAKVARFQDTKGTRSPPFLSKDENLRNSTQGVPRGHLVTPRTRSPVSYEDLHPFVGIEGQAFSSSGMGSQPRLLHDHAELHARQEPSLGSHFEGSYSSGRSFPVNHDAVQYPKRTRPFVSPVGLNTSSNANFGTHDSRDNQRSLQSASNTISEASVSNLTSIPVVKRTRSPPLLPENQEFNGNSYATQDGTEREMQAKAKRLARFKVELSKTQLNSPDIVEQGVSANRHEQSNVETKKLAGYNSTELAMDGTDGNALSEYEGVEPSGIIIGLCPDMCPESERAERERKGDLDQYERLDGDRNQTSMSLAVKKYNRTAERDANLIRPMPILQNTIDYLLNLLDQPYNNRFLSIYNFLWDRMRAIRMDLRMQHIFDQEAITMLEQMIRLHIIAMHELCEYSRGEGFAEGFDAHLNIEQMNKTSVELFQLYDDHRKKGINIPTEKEFRGYYALLKLDKHPGYMVEPAELSLDLAKMTPQIRQTSEVLFARDVARACRTGNFIAFFRLARKASYLQACLMHAHFSKLRTQALASVHAGLQNNQGLPVVDIAKWLAMEEEEVESLSQYHGFALKSYQEPYMVKEGPFLDGDEDYPTTCSNLVNMKKSRRIVEDVLASTQLISSSAEGTKELQMPETNKPKHPQPSANKPEPKTISYVERERPVREVQAIEVIKSVHEDGKEMPNFQAVSSPKDVRQKHQMIQTPIFSSLEDIRQNQQMIQTPTLGQYSEDAHRVAAVSPSPWAFSSFKPQTDKVGTMEMPNKDARFSNFPEKYNALLSNSPERSMHSGMERIPLQIESKTALQEKSPVGTYTSRVEHPIGQTMVINELEEKETPSLYQEDENNDVMLNRQHEEVAEAKLKLIIRLWKRRSLKLRELREEKLLSANNALNSLSLGPQIHLKTDHVSTSGGFDIDLLLRERYRRHGQSWSRLDVSDVVADILGRRNRDARCVCWKTVVCSQTNNLESDELGQRSHALGAASWLLSKLMPSENDVDDDDEDLVISSRGVSIWKKWVRGQSGSDLTCYLSVIKDASFESFDNLSESVSGASAILFLTSERIPWKLQKLQLDNLLMSIPSGSCLPLLILSGSYRNDVADPSSTIVDNLGLHDLDKSRISSFLVVPLVENPQTEQLNGFFSDNRLREGLRWLASESPRQPILHHVKTRELILTHLYSSLEALDKMKDYEVGPDNCILAFNEAVDWSQKEIAAAAQENPSSWPCPEISLLEEFSDEYRVVKWYFPSVGWSSVSKIEPLISALGDCRLPDFPDDIPWLPRCNAGMEIENLKVELENGLVGYLTQSSKMMGLALAIKEAHVMLQRSCRLERHDSCCYIVPNWVMIFRRIFNWRLMGLANGAFSSAYISECPHLNTSLGNLGKLGLEDSMHSPYYLNQPSLDEIIEVGYSSPVSHRGQPLLESGIALPDTSPSGDFHEPTSTDALMEDETSLTHGDQAMDDVSHVNGRLENAGSEIVVAGKVTKGADKLSILLEQCNTLQNVIDEKLSVYF